MPAREAAIRAFDGNKNRLCENVDFSMKDKRIGGAIQEEMLLAEKGKPKSR